MAKKHISENCQKKLWWFGAVVAPVIVWSAIGTGIDFWVIDGVLDQRLLLGLEIGAGIGALSALFVIIYGLFFSDGSVDAAQKAFLGTLGPAFVILAPCAGP